MIINKKDTPTVKRLKKEINRLHVMVRDQDKTIALHQNQEQELNKKLFASKQDLTATQGALREGVAANLAVNSQLTIAKTCIQARDAEIVELKEKNLNLKSKVYEARARGDAHSSTIDNIVASLIEKVAGE